MTQHIAISQQIGKAASQIQTLASNPDATVWVSAAAGTGKTHMLTNRLLRLLLQIPHLPAQSILAITYTKAAAAEMRLRLFELLARWVYLPEYKLKQSLDELLDRSSSDTEQRHARTLYARLIDDPAGVGIATIHSFCEQILRQFPMEAGLTPGFTVLDSVDESNLLTQAISLALTEAPLNNPETLALVAEAAGDKALYTWLTGLIQGDEGRRLQRYLAQFLNIEDALDHLSNTLNINTRTPPDTALTMSDIPFNLCHQLIAVWQNSGVRAAQVAQQLHGVLMNPSPSSWKAYQRVWLTSKWASKAETTLFPKAAKAQLNDATLQAARDEQQRVYRATQNQIAWHSFNVTQALMRLAIASINHYKNLKRQHAAVDFADLIHHTHNLLHTPQLQDWVRFKLDRRIHHILLDEAQDTDKQQWEILQAFTDEFYAGKGQHTQVRTLFAVGDTKQSIYRFRGAEPEVFHSIHRYLAEKTAPSTQTFHALAMTTSFRSTPAVLKFIDTVFTTPTLRQALDPQISQLIHQPHKSGSGGMVELWKPEANNAAPPPTTPWQTPERQPLPPNAETRVYRQVAHKIQQIIASNTPLGTLGRPAELGDILILLRTRTSLGQLIAALDEAGLPHTGADRLNLQQSPAVQDLVALGWALHNPSLDLPLAHTLRGGLFGLTDAALNDLKCQQVQKNLPTLWAALSQTNTTPLHQYFTTLNDWRRLAQQHNPATLYKQILQQHQGRVRLLKRFGHSTSDLGWLDPIDAFLTLAEDFSQKDLTGLPGFLNWFGQQQTDHKKETSAAHGHIRVMTIHSAKGLEAPIVFLPDLVTPPYVHPTSLWWYTPENTVKTTLVVHPGGAKTPIIEAAERHENNQRRADEARLLYVALTRARDQLYIGGTTGRKQHNSTDEDLYTTLQKSLQSLQATSLGDILHYEEPLNQIYSVKPSATRTPPTLHTNLPRFTRTMASGEKTKLPRRASHGQGNPLQSPPPVAAQIHAMSRGQHLHKLLELLSASGVPNPQASAESYLKQFASELPAETHHTLTAQALNVITRHPNLFGAQSRPEVALRVEQPNTILTVRIDRLVVTPTEVIIIDFKSDTAPTAEKIEEYYQQLRVYLEAVNTLYPHIPIQRAGLLWTSDPEAKLTWLA